MKKDLRRKPREYLAAICNQLVVPYLGLQAIRNPDDENVQEQYWRLKEEEIYFESYLQASLQIYIIVNDGVPHGSPSWIGNDDIPFNAVFRISSLIISCLSLFYGLSKIDLINMTTSEPGTCSTIKLFLTELPRKIAVFLRVLICLSLYYVDEKMLTCAIIYTCLDFVPIIVIVILMIKDDFNDAVTDFRKIFGIKSILDPNRLWFKAFKVTDVDSGPDDLNTVVIVNSISTIWYSLLGFTFSGIFIIFDFSCDEIESCDQDADRISRFHAFFIFSMIINVLAVVYSFASGCSAGCYDKTLFQLDVPEEQREEKETNVLAVVYSIASGCIAGCYDKTLFQLDVPEEQREEEEINV